MVYPHKWSPVSYRSSADRESTAAEDHSSTTEPRNQLSSVYLLILLAVSPGPPLLLCVYMCVCVCVCVCWWLAIKVADTARTASTLLIRVVLRRRTCRQIRQVAPALCRRLPCLRRRQSCHHRQHQHQPKPSIRCSTSLVSRSMTCKSSVQFRRRRPYDRPPKSCLRYYFWACSDMVVLNTATFLHASSYGYADRSSQRAVMFCGWWVKAGMV